jgi:hypothetical protein
MREYILPPSPSFSGDSTSGRLSIILKYILSFREVDAMKYMA